LFKKFTFKKRYLAVALIGAEIVSIPVSAQIIDKVAFSVPQRVIAVPFPPEAGVTKFLVSSNAPFAVVSDPNAWARKSLRYANQFIPDKAL